MTENKDLKSKILLMRQKNFGEAVSEPNEKNDNEKPESSENKQGDPNINISSSGNDFNQNKIQEDVQSETSSNLSELKDNLNKVSKTNEKAFDLLANKFNESVEVILELTQRVEKLETIAKLQSMQQSVDRNEVKPSQKGIKFFIFLIFIAGISYFLYKFNIDLKVLKDISRDFLGILGK